jgi:5-enolpyruvylshikimate-3-phosphate synthase
MTQSEPKRAAAKASHPFASEDSNSVVKAQKSLAAFNYRREEEATAKVNTHSLPKTQPAKIEAANSGEGLRRLRAIARKIDGSVDV